MVLTPSIAVVFIPLLLLVQVAGVFGVSEGIGRTTTDGVHTLSFNPDYIELLSTPSIRAAFPLEVAQATRPLIRSVESGFQLGSPFCTPERRLEGRLCVEPPVVHPRRELAKGGFHPFEDEALSLQGKISSFYRYVASIPVRNSGSEKRTSLTLISPNLDDNGIEKQRRSTDATAKRNHRTKPQPTTVLSADLSSKLAFGVNQSADSSGLLRIGFTTFVPEMRGTLDGVEHAFSCNRAEALFVEETTETNGAIITSGSCSVVSQDLTLLGTLQYQVSVRSLYEPVGLTAQFYHQKGPPSDYVNLRLILKARYEDPRPVQEVRICASTNDESLEELASRRGRTPGVDEVTRKNGERHCAGFRLWEVKHQKRFWRGEGGGDGEGGFGGDPLNGNRRRSATQVGGKQRSRKLTREAAALQLDDNAREWHGGWLDNVTRVSWIGGEVEAYMWVHSSRAKVSHYVRVEEPAPTPNQHPSTTAAPTSSRNSSSDHGDGDARVVSPAPGVVPSSATNPPPKKKESFVEFSLDCPVPEGWGFDRSLYDRPPFSLNVSFLLLPRISYDVEASVRLLGALARATRSGARYVPVVRSFLTAADFVHIPTYKNRFNLLMTMGFVLPEPAELDSIIRVIEATSRATEGWMCPVGPVRGGARSFAELLHCQISFSYALTRLIESLHPEYLPEVEFERRLSSLIHRGRHAIHYAATALDALPSLGRRFGFKVDWSLDGENERRKVCDAFAVAVAAEEASCRICSDSKAPRFRDLARDVCEQSWQPYREELRNAQYRELVFADTFSQKQKNLSIESPLCLGYSGEDGFGPSSLVAGNAQQLKTKVSKLISPFAVYFMEQAQRELGPQFLRSDAAGEMVALVEGANGGGGALPSDWVFTDDNARSLELLALPGAFDHPALRAPISGIVSFLTNAMREGFVFRRVALDPNTANAGPFDVEEDRCRQLKLSNGLMTFRGSPLRFSQSFRVRDNTANPTEVVTYQGPNVTIHYADPTGTPSSFTVDLSSPAVIKVSSCKIELVSDQLMELSSEGSLQAPNGATIAHFRYIISIASVNSTTRQTLKIIPVASAAGGEQEEKAAGPSLVPADTTNTSEVTNAAAAGSGPKYRVLRVDIAFKRLMGNLDAVVVDQICRGSPNPAHRLADNVKLWTTQKALCEPVTVGTYDAFGSEANSGQVPFWTGAVSKRDSPSTYSNFALIQTPGRYLRTSYEATRRFFWEKEIDGPLTPRIDTIVTHYGCDLSSGARADGGEASDCVITESNLITASGVAGAIEMIDDVLRPVVQEKVQGMIDFSVSYEVGLELNALSVLYLLDSQDVFRTSAGGVVGIGRTKPPIRPVAGFSHREQQKWEKLNKRFKVVPPETLRKAIDRHLDIYFSIFANYTDAGWLTKVSVKSLSFAIMAANNMLCTTKELKYLRLVEKGVRYLSDSFLPGRRNLLRCIGTEEWAGIECEATGLLAVSRLLATFPFGISSSPSLSPSYLLDFARRIGPDAFVVANKSAGIPQIQLDGWEGDDFWWAHRCGLLLRSYAALKIGLERYPELTLSRSTIENMENTTLQCEQYLDRLTVQVDAERRNVRPNAGSPPSAIFTEGYAWTLLGKFGREVEGFFQYHLRNAWASKNRKSNAKSVSAGDGTLTKKEDDDEVKNTMQPERYVSKPACLVYTSEADDETMKQFLQLRATHKFDTPLSEEASANTPIPNPPVTKKGAVPLSAARPVQNDDNASAVGVDSATTKRRRPVARGGQGRGAGEHSASTIPSTDEDVALNVIVSSDLSVLFVVLLLLLFLGKKALEVRGKRTDRRGSASTS